MITRIQFDEGEILCGEQPLFFEYESLDGSLTEGTTGYGAVRYGEGSVYRGSLIYCDGRFQKYGFGEQDFRRSTITCEGIGGPSGGKLYKFVGQYNFRVTQWIYGNGIVYFLDEKDRPLAYCKGFFRGLDLVGKWRGKFQKEFLLPGFDPRMEISGLSAHKKRWEDVEAKCSGSFGSVLIGDSWFEFFEETPEGKPVFHAVTRGKEVLDIGVGGSTYEEWLAHAEVLRKLRANRFFLNLGFNDLHSGNTPRKVFANFQKLVDAIRKEHPQAEILVLAVCPSTAHRSYHRMEGKLNAMISDFASRYMNMRYIPCNETFLKRDGEALDDLGELMICDGIHLNEKGYQRWVKSFEDKL